MTTNPWTGKNAVLRGKDQRRVPIGKTVTTVRFSFIPSSFRNTSIILPTYESGEI